MSALFSRLGGKKKLVRREKWDSRKCGVYNSVIFCVEEELRIESYNSKNGFTNLIK